jgi:hypothetical protein
MVSNAGRLSEPFWRNLRCVTLASAPDADSIAAAAERMLRLPPADRQAMGVAGRGAYLGHFSIEKTVCRLRAGAGLSDVLVDDLVSV